MHFQYRPWPSPSNIPILVKAPYTINPTTSTISTEDIIWVYDCAQLKSFLITTVPSLAGVERKRLLSNHTSVC